MKRIVQHGLEPGDAVTRTNHPLNFLDLSPPDFERLCLWLARREGFSQVETVGVSGNDGGKDLVAWRAGRRIVFQCKREKSFGPREAVEVVEKILALPEAARPAELVLVVACDLSDTARKAARERCAGIFDCTFWARTELDEKVKRHDDVVQEFFGALPSRPAVPFVLPQADVSTFTGRAEELAVLRELLVERRGPRLCSVVGLAGTGGIGKSALASHFAEVYRGDFPDGVIGHRVDGKDVATLAHEFLRSYGTEVDPEDERSASALMQETFRHRRALLIFDNADDAVIRQLLPGGDRCAVIITTRDQGIPRLLDVPEQGRIDLPVLPSKESRALLGKLVGEDRLHTEPDAINEIIRLVGNLPLALQIVGAMLQVQSWRPLGDYAASLREERSRLEKLKIRGASHLDVRASFSLSLQALHEPEIDFLACLSVCARNGFSLRAALAASGAGEETANEALGSLCRYSLLNRVEDDQRKFFFHPLVHLFATEIAEEKALKLTAEERHFEFFSAFAKSVDIEALGGDSQLLGDFDDILLSMERLRQHDRAAYDLVIRLTPFFERQGFWKEATSLMESFLALAEELDDWNAAVQLRVQRARFLSLTGRFADADAALSTVEAMLNRISPPQARLRSEAMWLKALGVNKQRLGDFDRAVDALQRSYRISEQLTDQRSLAMVLRSLGVVFQRQGHFDQAADVFQRSYGILGELGDSRGLAKILNSLGGVFQRQGHFDQAADALQRSYGLFVELRDPRGQAMVLNSLGGVFQRQGHFDQAADAFQRSLGLEFDLGNERGQAMVFNSLGGVFQRQGLFEQAVDAFQRSYNIAEQLADQRSLAMVLNGLGGVFQRQGRFEQAVDAFQRSYKLLVDLGDPRGQAMVLNSLGGVFQRQGRFDQAVDAFQQSYSIRVAQGDQQSQAMVLNSLGGVFQRQGHFDQAVDAFQRSYSISEQLGDQRSLAMVLNSLGGVFQRQGRFDAAVDVFQQSLHIGEELHDSRHQAMVLNSLGGTLHRQGRVGEALATLEKSKHIGEKLDDFLHLSMVHTNKGKVLAAERRYEEAAEELRKGFELNLRLRNQRGLTIGTPPLIKTLQKLDRQEEALEFCRQALAVAPNDRTLLGLQKRLIAGPAARPRALVKHGVLKRILTHQRGYHFAFVAPDDGSPDIYVREGYVGPINFSDLREGLAVEVEIEQVPQGPRAVRLQVLPGATRNAPTSTPSS